MDESIAEENAIIIANVQSSKFTILYNFYEFGYNRISSYNRGMSFSLTSYSLVTCSVIFGLPTAVDNLAVVLQAWRKFRLPTKTFPSERFAELCVRCASTFFSAFICNFSCLLCAHVITLFFLVLHWNLKLWDFKWRKIFLFCNKFGIFYILLVGFRVTCISVEKEVFYGIKN